MPYVCVVCVICVVKSHADFITSLLLTSVFPEQAAKREGQSGAFLLPPMVPTPTFLSHLQVLSRPLSPVFLVAAEPSSSRPPRWEKISTSQRPKRIVLQQYAGGG